MKTTIQNILSSEYGVGVVAAEWATVTWAAAKVEKTMGAMEAAKELRKVNRIRESHGVYTNIPEYGTDLYRAYFAK